MNYSFLLNNNFIYWNLFLFLYSFWFWNHSISILLMISFKITHSFMILYFVFKYFIHLELILIWRMGQRSSFLFLICLLKNPFSTCQSILPTDLKWHFYYKLHSHILISISRLSFYLIDLGICSSAGSILLTVILQCIWEPDREGLVTPFLPCPEYS